MATYWLAHKGLVCASNTLGHPNHEVKAHVVSSSHLDRSHAYCRSSFRRWMFQRTWKWQNQWNIPRQDFSYLPQMTLQEEVGENTAFVLVTPEKGARRQQESNCLRRKGATHGPEGKYFLVKIFSSSSIVKLLQWLSTKLRLRNCDFKYWVSPLISGLCISFWLISSFIIFHIPALLQHAICKSFTVLIKYK